MIIPYPPNWEKNKAERDIIAILAAILLATINASREGHGILDTERRIAVREARYLLEEIDKQFQEEPTPRQ